MFPFRGHNLMAAAITQCLALSRSHMSNIKQASRLLDFPFKVYNNNYVASYELWNLILSKDRTGCTMYVTWYMCVYLGCCLVCNICYCIICHLNVTAIFRPLAPCFHNYLMPFAFVCVVSWRKGRLCYVLLFDHLV